MLGIFVTAITIISALFVFFGAISDFWSMVSNIPFIQRQKFNEEQREVIANYLKADNYYQNLSIEGKNKFINRLIRFMVNKEFEGREGLTVTEEMKVEISASAIRLTFGLDQFILPNFDTIWIFPEIFVFGLDRLKMKGGTTPGGRVMLSWKDFISGNANPTDRINLGLHEFAHALKIEVADGDEFDKRFTAFYPEWEKAGTVEMMRMRSKKSAVLREYASANINEFFAVSVEHFFERPAELKSLLPELYNHFVWLLNQDPLNTL
ncbi:MAG TPA: zinc-dependent peptidase, partial [Bacteroidia bacterium]|nr:zinc-dependent peptidase [Bacteroidia bacterium]